MGAVKASTTTRSEQFRRARCGEDEPKVAGQDGAGGVGCGRAPGVFLVAFAADSWWMFMIYS